MPGKTQFCEACGAEGRFSILLAAGEHGEGPLEKLTRWYIPNQSFRATDATTWSEPEEVWFCHPCMRKIEDNLRATIMSIQADNNLLKVEPV